MEKIELIKERPGLMYQVTSEPGDMTQYDFFVYRDGPDEFCFMPRRSTFRFPQRLNWYDYKAVKDEDLIRLSEEFNTNPHTLKECIRIMKIIKEKY